MNRTNNSNGQPQQHNIGFAQVPPEVADSHATDKAIAVKQDFAETWLALTDEHGIHCAEAQYFLAECYRRGVGVEKSPELAFELFEKAANTGFFKAIDQLVLCYENGIGVEQSYEMAKAVIVEMRESDDSIPFEYMHSKDKTDSLVLLGDLYAHGNGVDQCDEFAFMLYERAYDTAAENNGCDAAFRLSVCYFEGRGVDKNKDVSWEMLNEAAMQNHELAINKIAIEYYLMAQNFFVGQEGYDRNIETAFKWFTKAAELGYADALGGLGILYQHGEGVEQSAERAFKCYKEAVDLYENKDKDEYVHKNLTYFLLANCYAMGIGVAKDEIKAEYFKRRVKHDELGEYIEKYTADLMEMSPSIGIAKEMLPQRLGIHISKKQYVEAEQFIEKVFENAKHEQASYKDVCLTTIKQAKAIDEKNKELEARNKLLQEKEKELEDMMSMFAHKFRSPLDAIIYNTTHDNQVKLYAEAAQTMRGLLDIFSMISTDEDLLKTKIKQDCQGAGRLKTVFGKTLDTVLLHLLSKSGAEKIQQHYMAYAKAHGQCDEQVSYKKWCEEHFELEQTLRAEWEQSFALLLNQSATLEQRLAWLEQHFFKLELIGFERDDIQFKEYGATESFLTILLNEILVNAFKYYSSASKQAVVLEWAERDGYQVLICRNPSIRSERTTIKGSHKGHTFLSALARKTGSAFTKPTPQDDFVVEFGIPDEFLISK